LVSAMIEIFGVSGSPRRDGNTDQCLQEALQACSRRCRTQLVSLANLKIAECNGCNRCKKEGTRKLPCPAHDDDMTPLYERLGSADGFLFASPVYYGSVTGIMKLFMDRFLPFYDESGSRSELKGALRFKPAGAIAVGGGRNDGIEAVLYTLHRFFLFNDMLVVGTAGYADSGSNLGGTVFSDDRPDALARDALGKNTLRALGNKVSLAAERLANQRS
jgi:multimeric flavodoxin WrbA